MNLKSSLRLLLVVVTFLTIGTAFYAYGGEPGVGKTGNQQQQQPQLIKRPNLIDNPRNVNQGLAATARPPASINTAEDEEEEEGKEEKEEEEEEEEEVMVVEGDDPRHLRAMIPLRTIEGVEPNVECDAFLSLSAKLEEQSRHTKGTCSDSGVSEVMFYDVAATREDLMVVTNLTLDFARHKVSTVPNYRGLPEYNHAVHVACKPDNGLLAYINQAHYQVQFHIDSLLHGKVDFGPDEPLPGCTRTETRPTVFFTREGTTGSLWHNLLEHLGLYYSMAMESSRGLNDFQVVIMDGHHWIPGGQGPGNLVPLIEALTPYPVLDSHDFKGELVCFSRGIFPISGWRNHLWHHVWDLDPCQVPSQALFNFQFFALQGLGIDPVAPPTWPRDVIRIFYLERGGKTRHMRNQQEFLALLSSIQFPGFKIEVIAKGFTHSQTFREQVDLVRGCDVLISPHGAGLTNMVFGRRNLAVVEVFNHEHQKATYFHNLASHLIMFYEAHPPHPSVAGSDDVMVDLTLMTTTLTTIFSKIRDLRTQ